MDKLTYAALEATLADYLSDSPELIPTVRMLRAESHEIKTRCERIVRQLSREEPLQPAAGGRVEGLDRTGVVDPAKEHLRRSRKDERIDDSRAL